MKEIKKICVGSIFGKLTIISDTEQYAMNGKTKIKIWKIKCECGVEFEGRCDYIRRGDLHQCKNCSKVRARSVKIGETYDQLTIIDFTHETGRIQAVCTCSCGNIVNRRPELLKRINLTNNCGCRPRGGWSGAGKLATAIFTKYKNNAKKRGITFEITIEYLWELYEKQNGKCALSGLDISFGKLTTDKKNASIDRIDSSKGYIEGNIQWVHKQLNYMKWNIDQDKFIEYCKLVVQYNA